MELDFLKKEYDKILKKFNLPSFKDLNRDFEIDKLEKETDSLLRSIRKLMMEKIVNSMSFLEMLINPINAPRMYMPYIKTMEIDDKKKIDRLYKEMADLSLISLDLEVESVEKDEAELIKIVYKKWQELKPLFKDILKNIKEPKEFVKKERSYFG